MGSFAYHDTDCVVAERGGIIENYHRVHAAIVDASTGQLLYAVGNPQHVIHIRSAAKPAQALAVLEACNSSSSSSSNKSTGIDALLDDADIALLCASHNSEPRHIDRVRALQHKLGVRETDLQCGPHPSISPTVQQDWIQQNLTPTAVHSNCSGKHTGMLAAARALTGKPDDYHLPQHPLQIHIRQVMQDLSGAPRPDSIAWGLDGCNLPAPAMELTLAARIYSQLAAAVDAEPSTADIRTTRLARIYHGMTRHPAMVAGEGRFCTQLMEAYEGAVVGKVGAEACYGIGVRASSACTREARSPGAMGIMVKIEDGNMDVLHAAVVEILAQLNVGSMEQRARLSTWHHPVRVNTRNIPVGAIQPRLSVRRI